MVLGHTHAEENESRYRPYNVLQNSLKINQRPKCKTQNYKTPKR